MFTLDEMRLRSAIRSKDKRSIEFMCKAGVNLSKDSRLETKRKVRECKN